MITFKYRFYPNHKQQEKLWEHSIILTKLYNYFLNQRIEKYENEKKSINKKEQQLELKFLKIKDEKLKEIHSQVLQQVTLRLDNTYKTFFRKGFGFPKFKSSKYFFTITYPQNGFSVEGNKFITKIYGKVRFLKHIDLKGNIKQISISNKDNKWHLHITTDFEKEKTIINEFIGIDVGITNIYADSEGKIKKNCSHSKYFDKQINKLKSRRDKCKNKSNKRYFLTEVIQRLYDVKNRKINDFQHKVSKNLSRNYDTIYVEDLKLKKMSEKKITGLNRELRNSKLAQFLSFLEYKTNKMVKVNPKNTSKTCSCCGKIQNMPLYKREYVCECGYKENRDINSAKNIYCLGRAIDLGLCAVSSTIQEALTFR